MRSDSVWFGDGHQGIKGKSGLPPGSYCPLRGTLTELVEPCGALPRKCLRGGLALIWF
jgi:hypothetical protein